MQKDDHFTVTWLVEGMLNVVVQNIDFVASYGGEAKTVTVRFQSAFKENRKNANLSNHTTQKHFNNNECANK